MISTVILALLIGWVLGLATVRYGIENRADFRNDLKKKIEIIEAKESA